MHPLLVALGSFSHSHRRYCCHFKHRKSFFNRISSLCRFHASRSTAKTELVDGFHAQRLGRFALGVDKPVAPGPGGSAVSHRNRATNQRKSDVKPPRRSTGRAAAAPALPRLKGASGRRGGARPRVDGAAGPLGCNTAQCCLDLWVYLSSVAFKSENSLSHFVTLSVGLYGSHLCHAAYMYIT